MTDERKAENIIEVMTAIIMTDFKRQLPAYIQHLRVLLDSGDDARETPAQDTSDTGIDLLADDLINVQEVADILDVTVGRVRQLASTGALKGKRFGGPDRGMWVFRLADVEQFATVPRVPGRRRKRAYTQETPAP